MKKILFVDDEIKVLSGLRRMLRGLRRDWDMLFVESGPESLIHMCTTPFDVIITDMRMPGMNGAQLLDYVVKEHPSVVRIILSGQCERNAVLKCVGPAHQFLTKPCDSEMLKETVARACRLRDHLPNEDAQKAVSCVQSLPSQPHLYAELCLELEALKPCIQKICTIISQDPAMTAKVLQLVSSGFLGTPQCIYDIRHAVKLLGLETIRDLVDHTDAFAPLDSEEDFSTSKHIWDTFIQHCLLVAKASKEIAQSETDNSSLIASTYLAGMLHDIAIYVLTKNSAKTYEEMLALALQENMLLAEVEERILHTRRDLAGAYLMGLWGLPDHIIHVIDHHLLPGNSSDSEFGPLAAVHVANAIMEEEASDVTGPPTPIDMDFLEKIGCAERLDRWREICLSTISEGVLS